LTAEDHKRAVEDGLAILDMVNRDICAVRFGALEEVFMLYRPHGAWRTMEVLEELA
jgi:hypothetical protein